MQQSLKDKETAHTLAEMVSSQGGRAYYVGGCVRDAIMGRECKDIDIEVHGLSPQKLEKILDSLGERISIGESFGIFNLKGCGLDIAMPRREKLRGHGHKDFDIITDPFIGTEAAAKRRDFTINALMQDILSGEIIDHFNGRSDLQNKILRHVNTETFTEDPLRVLRGAQFAARFDLDVAAETVELCRIMHLGSLPGERIEGELKKALMKAQKPSVFFETLREMEALDTWFPELKALIGLEQSPIYHAEGDVWTHTMMVLDQAAKLKHKSANPYWFMLSALCHDFGKAICTEVVDGVIRSYKHEILGLPLVDAFLSRITKETKLRSYVLNMTELHMQPITLAASASSIKATNRMFDKSLDPQGLISIAQADDKGRISTKPVSDYEAFLYDRLDTYKEYMSRPYVMGKDLMQAGLQPGKNFSDILSYAHKLRLAGVPKEQALKQLISYASRLK